MNWTRPEDIRRQLLRLWERGLLQRIVLNEIISAQSAASPACDAGNGADLCDGDNTPPPPAELQFPLRLTLKAPSNAELSTRFGEVRAWLAQLQAAAQHYRLEFRRVRLRQLGDNEVLSAIWIDGLDQALALCGKKKDAQRLRDLARLTCAEQAALLPWLRRKPLTMLALANDWPRLLAVVAWLKEHPRPGIYLRQIDLPGVHSKFIEQHRGVLQELLDCVLPAAAIDERFRGSRNFCPRYGFLDKPLQVRFRILDPQLRLFAAAGDHDLSVTETAFASLQLPVTRVFITENEVNFLAFPALASSLVIFGSGYGFANLAAASWLKRCGLYYWGDIDTHGFAILNQLRASFPSALSLLMDSKTFLAHRPLWGREEKPEKGELSRLRPAEAQLYAQLRDNSWGEQLRLEQEHIGYQFLRATIAALL
jgi:hypothetical protein